MNRLESYIPKQPNLTGTVLVASPMLAHTPMAEAVILVVQDSETGVFGARINNTASSQQANEFEKISQLSSQRDSLMIGGPLDGPVMALHQNEALAEMQIRDGVFVSCSQEALRAIVEGEVDEDGFEYASPESSYRIVLGVAGWQTPQIHAEIKSGLWYPVEGEADIVFEDSASMWFTALRRYGDNMMTYVTGYDPAGIDCGLN